VRTLGKQWSLRARLVRAHEFIHEGPYAFVRHPTYTAMFGMLLGTALGVGSWQAMISRTVVFLLGTAWRIRAEERLLVEGFGAAYREYVATVPALVPWLRLSDVPATRGSAGHHWAPSQQGQNPSGKEPTLRSGRLRRIGKPPPGQAPVARRPGVHDTCQALRNGHMHAAYSRHRLAMTRMPEASR
jgi:hypothetical protein